MKQYALLVWLLMALVMPLRARAGEAPPPAEKLGDNAALKYWIAFDCMSKLTPEQDAIVGNWRETPLNDAAAAVAAGSTNALRIFHEASKFPRCDWGLVKEGPVTQLPHLVKARQLARLACLRARYRASKGDGEGAVEDLLDVFTLSRHFYADGPLISYLVHIAIENIATNAAADDLKRLKPAQLKKLAAGLETLPAAKGFREAILSESDDMLGWQIEHLKKDGVRAAEEFNNAIEAEKTAGMAADKETIKQTVNRHIQELEKAREYYARLAELGKFPLAEFDRQAKLIEDGMKKDCPTESSVVAAFSRARYEEARSEARMAMLKAAIAVVLDGPDRLKDFKDPFGDGPFEYRPIGNGFQLKSKLDIGDASVGMTVPGAN